MIKEQQLQQLETQLDDGPLSSTDRSRLSRLRRQVNDPTPRQKIHGVFPGRLKEEEEIFIRVLGVLREAQKLLEEETI